MDGRPKRHFLAQPRDAGRGDDEHPRDRRQGEQELEQRDARVGAKGPGALRAPGGRSDHRPLPTGTALAGFSFGAAGGEERREAEEEERTLAVSVVGPLTVT